MNIFELKRIFDKNYSHETLIFVDSSLLSTNIKHRFCYNIFCESDQKNYQISLYQENIKHTSIPSNFVEKGCSLIIQKQSFSKPYPTIQVDIDFFSNLNELIKYLKTIPCFYNLKTNFEENFYWDIYENNKLAQIIDYNKDIVNINEHIKYLLGDDCESFTPKQSSDQLTDFTILSKDGSIKYARFKSK